MKIRIEKMSKTEMVLPGFSACKLSNQPGIRILST